MDKGVKNKQSCQWYNQLIGISLFGLYAAITLETSTNAVTVVAKLDNWRFNSKAQQLEITLTANTTPTYFYLAQPPRIVVDLPDTKLGYVATQQNYSGAIRSIRISQLNASVTRIVLDLAPGNVLNPKQVKLQPISRQNRTRWVLRPVTSVRSLKAGVSPSPLSNRSAPSQNIAPPPSNPPLTPAQYLQPPSNPQQPLLTFPPPSSNLPPITTNSQQPFVTVPPLSPNQPSQLLSPILPPPNFPNQPNNLNSEAQVPTVPNVSNPPVIEFGQPLPKTK